MATLVDSSIFIAVERGKLDLEQHVQQQGDESIAIAAITASELLHGVHRAVTAAQRARRHAFVEQLLAGLTVLPFDLIVARAHASIWAQLAAKGISVGAHDLLIAATAQAFGYDVATRDKRSFSKVPGLKVIRW